MKLDHIAIAVKSINESLAIWQELLGLNLLTTEEVPEQKVKVAILELGETHIELLEPISADSPVAKFIEKRGEGLHHIAIEVEDIKAELKKLKDAGTKLIDETPRTGAMGKKIAFIHPSGTNGVLIELTEG